MNVLTFLVSPILNRLFYSFCPKEGKSYFSEAIIGHLKMRDKYYLTSQILQQAFLFKINFFSDYLFVIISSKL